MINKISTDDIKKKILYRSIHRGCKETDHLIGNFAKNNIDKLNIEELILFEKLIQEDDLLIYDWIISKQECKLEYFELIKKIQIYHNL